MQTRKVPCNICGVKATQFIITLCDDTETKYDVVRCAKCGLIFVEDMPVITGELYDEDYYGSDWGDEGVGYTDEAKVASLFRECGAQWEFIEKVIPYKGRVLDFGCGDGKYLKVAHERGWEAYGVEVSAYAAAYGREHYAVNVFTGELKDAGFPPDFFDIVRLKHVIEHLTDPLGTLRELRRVTKPGGYVIIDTDNAGSLRTKLESILRRMMGGSLTSLFIKAALHKRANRMYGRLRPPIHLYYFGEDSMRRMLEQSGFVVERVLKPAQGHKVFFPQLHRYRANPVELAFRLVDDGGGMFGMGEVLVVFARKTKETKE